MILKKFISYSVIAHLLAMSLLLIRPAPQEQKAAPFFARLVSPEDVLLKDNKSKSGARPSEDKPVKLSPSITKEAPKVFSSEQAAPSKPRGKDSQNKSPISAKKSSSQAKEINESDSNIIPGESVMPAGKGKSLPFGKGNLFDREIIAKSVEKSQGQDGKSSVTFDAKEFKYYGYMQRLKEKIEGLWRYPTDAAGQGIYGDLYIRFTINKNGSLDSVELLRTSGHRNLDDAAIRALKEAAPYWPLPEEWKKENLPITGHFIYSLYGTYLR